MSATNIEWSDEVWNPVTGCTRVSAGCDHCYAVTQSHIRGSNPAPAMQRKYAGLTVLNGKGDRHFNGKVRTHDDVLPAPFGWKKGRRVFVNSMSDLFHRDVPFEFIDKVFAVMALTPQHTYQILTKRPDRMATYTTSAPAQRVMAASREIAKGRGPAVMNASAVICWPLPNVWLGTSVENQEAADARIPHLLKCPAAVRFLSCEPLLGPVDLADWLDDPGLASSPDQHIPDRLDIGLHWIIVGGESGPNARPMHPDWARSLRDQCQAAGVAFFFKQWGEWVPAKQSGRYSSTILTGHVGLNGQMNGAIWGTYPPPEFMVRLGKNAAGRLLDGVEHNAMPAAPAEVK